MGGKIMEIKTRQIDDKPLTIIIEYFILDAKTKKLIQKIESLENEHLITGDLFLSFKIMVLCSVFAVIKTTA